MFFDKLRIACNQLRLTVYIEVETNDFYPAEIMTQTQTTVCHQCGKSMSGKLPGSSCPQCLMALAMSDGSNTPTTGPNGGALSDSLVPPIEKLVAEFSTLR